MAEGKLSCPWLENSRVTSFKNSFFLKKGEKSKSNKLPQSDSILVNKTEFYPSQDDTLQKFKLNQTKKAKPNQLKIPEKS